MMTAFFCVCWGFLLVGLLRYFPGLQRAQDSIFEARCRTCSILLISRLGRGEGVGEGNWPT